MCGKMSTANVNAPAQFAAAGGVVGTYWEAPTTEQSTSGQAVLGLRMDIPALRVPSAGALDGRLASELQGVRSRRDAPVERVSRGRSVECLPPRVAGSASRPSGRGEPPPLLARPGEGAGPCPRLATVEHQLGACLCQAVAQGEREEHRVHPSSRRSSPRRAPHPVHDRRSDRQGGLLGQPLLVVRGAGRSDRPRKAALQGRPARPSEPSSDLHTLQFAQGRHLALAIASLEEVT